MRVRISWPNGEVTAELADTPTTAALKAALPVRGSASTWGEEVYFSVPLSVDLEADARQVVDPGTVCFWVDGGALALPYGPTPISQGDECRLAGACNVARRHRRRPATAGLDQGWGRDPGRAGRLRRARTWTRVVLALRESSR